MGEPSCRTPPECRSLPSEPSGSLIVELVRPGRLARVRIPRGPRAQSPPGPLDFATSGLQA
eukprot:12885527-Alexandrium_andersonii.AAC.1